MKEQLEEIQERIRTAAGRIEELRLPVRGVCSMLGVFEKMGKAGEEDIRLDCWDMAGLGLFLKKTVEEIFQEVGELDSAERELGLLIAGLGEGSAP